MTTRLEQPSFAGGEVSRHLEARKDVAKRATAARRARNVMIRPEGGLMSRPGFMFVGAVEDHDRIHRLMTFQFSPDQSYALIFGQGTMRPAANGGLVLEELLTITAITNANPGEIEAAFHAYEVGQEVFISGVSGMTEINGRTVRVTAVVDDDHFEIDLDTTSFGVFTSDTGGTTRTGAPDPPPTPPDVDPPVDFPEPPNVTDPPGFPDDAQVP